MSGLNAEAVLNAIVSNSASLGVFDRVNTYEPKAAPGHGLSLGIWLDSIGPAVGLSGLRTTTARMVFVGRVFTSMIQEPQSQIDLSIINAIDSLFAAFTGDFDLGGNVKNIDILGAQGIAMSARAAYVTVDKTSYRTLEIVLPVIINDAWDQVN